MPATRVQKVGGMCAQRELNSLSREELPARVAMDIASLGREQALLYLLEFQRQLKHTLTANARTPFHVMTVDQCFIHSVAHDASETSDGYPAKAAPFPPEDAFLCLLDADIEKHPERIMDVPDDLEALAARFRSKCKVDTNARLEGEGEVYL